MMEQPMPCATQASPTNRRKKPKVEYPCPYSKLPPEAQKAAREWWRECERADFDVDGMTEMLVNDLEYEFGIDVSSSTVGGRNGKPYSRFDIEWGFSYCQGDGVSFKANVDIDKLIAHGVPGCEYSSANAQRLGELWQAAQV